MKNAREAWRFRVPGRFPGSFLDVVRGVVVYKFGDREHYPAMGAISPEGARLWEQRWDDFAFFFASQERLYVDGDRARRICPETGRVDMERALGKSVELRCALSAGPVYRMPDEERYFGLDGETLATLWEVPEDDDFTFDEGRICRYRPSDGITILELPSLRQSGPFEPTTPLPRFGQHIHAGDSWCHFGSTEGGRAAVDLDSGEVLWRELEPGAYGLIATDGERAYSPRDGLAAYELSTGRLVWQRQFGEIPTSVPHVAKGHIYVATGDKYVHMLDAPTGEVLLSHRLNFEISGTIEPSPAVPLGENRILVGTQHEILCIEFE